MEAGQKEQSLHVCDFCGRQTLCRSVYVALKILQEEVKFAQDSVLQSRFAQFVEQLYAQGYSFPDGLTHCQLALEADLADEHMQVAQKLLVDLRQKVGIYTIKT